jgi:hypothetical protein
MSHQAHNRSLDSRLRLANKVHRKARLHSSSGERISTYCIILASLFWIFYTETILRAVAMVCDM